MHARRIEQDLALICVLTLALVFVILVMPVPPLRIALGFPFVVFFPGYPLAAALFPKKESLGVAQRVALSLGLSVAVMVLIGLMLGYAGWVGLYPVLASVTSFIFIVSGIAWYMRMTVSWQERFSIDIKLWVVNLWSGWKTANKLYRILCVFLLCAIFGGSAALGHVMSKPGVGQAFTEFYILDLEGRTENYPLELILGEEGRVVAGIVNREHKNTDYRLTVAIGGNEASELGPTELEPDERWQGVVGFIPSRIGDNQKVEFSLYQGNQLSEILHIWVDVIEP